MSTLAVLTGAGLSELPAMLAQMFTLPAACAYLVFTLLYTPCVAAVTTVRKEMNSRLYAIGVAFFQTALAWVIACVVYQLLRLFV